MSELARLSRRAFRNYPDGVVRLDTGDPGLDTPPEVRDAMIAALGEALPHYGPPLGDAELREQIAAHANERGSVRVSPGDVLVTHGAAAALVAGLCAALNPDDGVIILEPCYPIFPDAVRFAGGRPIAVAHAPDNHIDMDRLAAAARSARAIIICNPCSPTGVVYRRTELEQVAALAAEANLLVFSDEVYDRIVYAGACHTSLLELSELEGRLFYAQSFSKGYAMPGARLGYLIAPPSLFAECARVHRTINGSINPAAQRAALAALSLHADWLAGVLAEYKYRRDMVVDRLASVVGSHCVTPEATFAAWVRHPADISSDAIAANAVANGVSVRSGSEYGSAGEGHIAVSFSVACDSLSRGLDRLAAVLVAANEGS